MLKTMPVIIEKIIMPGIKTLMRLFFGLTIEGKEHLKPFRGKPFILAGTHTGWLDIPALLSATRKHALTFMVAEEVFSYPLVGKIVEFGNTLPIAKNKELSTLKSLVKCLNEGIPIAIFPEGKLSETGEIDKFQAGAGFLQRKTKNTILPFAISGGFQAWAYNKRFPSLFKKIILTFGEPILFEAGRSDDETIALLRTTVEALKKTGDAQLL
jgi:acyl-[acyl-carrier-protein]-phospholipid O-acyltransferase / long-chain-fatty-acid--[acyl-carrier-protein] ligase